MEQKQLQIISRILLNDPIWSAYALADLEPDFEPHAEWLVSPHAVVLIYHGLTPPLLFATGDPIEAGDLIKHRSIDECQYALLPNHRNEMSNSLKVIKAIPMWRMVHVRQSFEEMTSDDLRKLTPSDIGSIQRLFSGGLDSPDSFLPEQLSIGPFYGFYHRDQLVCIAGVHVVSRTYRVAAIGNVYVHKDHRGSGYARQATGQVVSDLIRQGMDHIVLNVAQENAAAIRVYESIGFRCAMEYTEGTARLVPSTLSDPAAHFERKNKEAKWSIDN
jgi:GNAT superfamily N-acetyltransferase